MQVDVYAYTSTDVYACTSADVWVLARVIDASQCIPMRIRIHKYGWVYYHSAFVCMCLRVIHTNSRTHSTLARLVMFLIHAELHWCECKLLLQILYAQLHFENIQTCLFAVAVVLLCMHVRIDTHWCACVPLLWCFLFMHVRLIYTDVHVFPCCDALFECFREWLMLAYVYACTSAAVWVLASVSDASPAVGVLARVVDASQGIRMNKCGCFSASESGWCKRMYMYTHVWLFEC